MILGNTGIRKVKKVFFETEENLRALIPYVRGIAAVFPNAFVMPNPGGIVLGVR